MLPDVAARVAGKRGESGYRAQKIGEQLAAYDLIGINEAFDSNYTRILLDSLQANTVKPFTVARGPERSGRHLIGSGLLLLSRWPIEDSHTMTYSHASRFLTSGFKADGFAAKGVLHARLRVGNDANATIDCFLTHLESQSNSAREKQITELSSFIALHARADNPIVVLGDFNVTADDAVASKQIAVDSPYVRLRRALSINGRQLIDVGQVCQPGHQGTSDALARDGDRRIDYIFVSDPWTTVSTRLIPFEAKTLPMLDDRVPEASLSDHLAVACRAQFSWGGTTSIASKHRQEH